MEIIVSEFVKYFPWEAILFQTANFMPLDVDFGLVQLGYQLLKPSSPRQFWVAWGYRATPKWYSWVAYLGFSGGEVTYYFGIIFSENCMKMKKLDRYWTDRSATSLTFLLKLWYDVIFRLWNIPLKFNNHFQHHEQTIALTVICFNGLLDQKNDRMVRRKVLWLKC